MFLQNTRLATRLAIGFAVMIVFVWGLGGVMLKRMTALTAEAQRIYEHPMTVSAAALEAKAAISAMEADLTDLLLPRNRSELQRILSEINARKVEIDQKMRVVERQFLGNPRDVSEAMSAIAEWLGVMNEVVALVKQQNYERAQGVHDEDMDAVETKIDKEMNDILSFAKEKARSIMLTSLEILNDARSEILTSLFFFTIFAISISVFITRSLSHPLGKLQDCMVRLAGGNLLVQVPFLDRRSEIGKMAETVQVFKESSIHLSDQRWLRAQIARLAMTAQTSDSPTDLGDRILASLLPEIGGRFGVFYFYDEAANKFCEAARLGAASNNARRRAYAIGEGLIGQCAALRRPLVIDDAPEDYFRIESGLGESKPRYVALIPAVARDRVLAVVEVGFFSPLTALHRQLVEEVGAILALNLDVLERHEQTRQLLEKTQHQAAELLASEAQLTVQAEELREANLQLQEKSDTLELQAEELRVSEEEMRVQQEELLSANQELSAKTKILEDQAKALNAARAEAEQRSMEATLASRYKSEFLANMSHELRTPLNSLLILAKSLAENEGGNLTPDQIESAGIIHDGGMQLLRLINDVLDLAKVEAGKMELQARLIPLPDFMSMFERRFRRMAQVKNIALTVRRQEDAPAILWTDSGKLEQILTNLLGNAVKFTESGRISLSFELWADERRRRERALGAVGDNDDLRIPEFGWLAFLVQDSGVGIAKEQLPRIFEAFEQGDGASNRRYGGTGLGLAISQKLARLMGGVILATSKPGVGSVFALLLPNIPPPPSELEPDIAVSGPNGRNGGDFGRIGDGPASLGFSASPGEKKPQTAAPNDASSHHTAPRLGDDRDHIAPGDQVMLIIEDDATFARIVMELARKKGFRCMAAADGETGVALAQRHRPTGVILDIGLPGMDGWGVMERLRSIPELRGVPIHVVSAQDRESQARAMGALGCLTKPVSKMQIENVLQALNAGRTRRLLVADADPESRKRVAELVRGIQNAENLILDEAENAQQVWELMRQHRHDCLLLDVDLTDGGGLALLERLRADKCLEGAPVIILSSRDLSREETNALRGFTDSIIINSAQFHERLLNEVTLFLHSVRAVLPNETRQSFVAHSPSKKHPPLQGRTILVVDDDMRNAFALSKVLRGQGMHVLIAQDGRKALAQLNENTRVEIVLMDVMMPEMDGYEAMREIRKQDRFATLPIIALTAKAMIGDAEKCLEAGADNYLAKPVDIDKLMSLLVHHIETIDRVRNA